GRGAAALAAGQGESFPHGEREPDAPDPGSPEGFPRGERRRGAGRGGREIGVTRVFDDDVVTRGTHNGDFVAGAGHRESQNVEARPDGADGAGRARRDTRSRGAHEPASGRRSFRTPAAVPAGPAPGPVITSGLVLYRAV